MPFLPQAPPPAIAAPAPSAAEAEQALLEAFDWGRPLPAPPKTKGPAALRLRWLRAAATFDPERELPVHPFAAGPARIEAEALRRLMRAPAGQIPSLLLALRPRESGTALALWRWGRLRVRAGAFDGALRRAWEDCLLSTGPALTRGYALRHALCFALADQDEARLARLRAAAGDEEGGLFQAFQRLFGLLGGPPPELRLWTLPGLEYRDLHLDELGATRIWICPLEEGALPMLPPGTAWILPSAAAPLDVREASLSEPLLTEGRGFAERLRTASRTAYFAPSRGAFEALGLIWFPILVELDDKGALKSIRMGDAAPPRP